MKSYLDLLEHVYQHGSDRDDRTGTGTRSVFGHQMRFDLSQGFPMLTTKKLHWKSIVHELLWFISGDTNVKYLQENGVRIWNEWATDQGDLGPVYGAQWRHWRTPNGDELDQLSKAMEDLKLRPNSRRIIISAWNPADLPDEGVSPSANAENGKMALAPCHAFIQFYVANGKLSCMLTQRSVDCFLGLAFNIPSYALLTHMVAQQCGLEVGDFVWSGGDVHIYHNHFEQVQTQLQRTPGALPTLKIVRKPESIDDYRFDDFELVGYEPQPHIPAPVAI
ncbi:thymidylate synthase [Ferrimonas aestuarii]|uniref:Thymidylate synthase n=1 Tax=Ferrimonas aestuarii TaxID=2569539 RepID=A0A4U1BP40_9GAMM|nr:thymidylate synthase [Ferrimonas aestuarii]TKB55299.1 thymidylate synthase [Ferrimonas aestuarii]